MEFIILLVSFMLFIGLFLPWFQFFSIRTLKQEIISLTTRLTSLEEKLSKSSSQNFYAQSLNPAQPSVNPSVPESKRDEEPESMSALATPDHSLGNMPSPSSPIMSQEISRRESTIPLNMTVESITADQTEQESTMTSAIQNSDGEDLRNERSNWASSFMEGSKNSPYKEEKNWVELNLATKIPVWIGAVSLIFAAFFLVKYSIELGWVGPTMRVVLGVLFGCGLITGGQWIRPRAHIANSQRIGQALVGAGLAALYVSLYSAISLYHMLPPLLGFLCMSMVTAWAVVLSMRHGQPIAVFGLLGGLLTPALINTGAQNAAALFGYLFLLFSGTFMVLIRRNWLILALISIIGVFTWSVIWFIAFFAATDAFVLVVFAMAVTAMVLGSTARHLTDHAIASQSAFQKDDTAYLNVQPRLNIHSINFTALFGGTMTILWLSLKITLSLFDWSILGLMSLALMALACFDPKTYQKPLLIKLAASLILLFSWSQQVPLLDSLLVIAGISLIYIGGGIVMLRQSAARQDDDNSSLDPRFWAILQMGAALALYLISYFVLDLPIGGERGPELFWSATALLLATFSTYLAAYVHDTARHRDDINNQVIAIYAFAASAFIALGLTIILPSAYLPLAITIQIAGTAYIYSRTYITVLTKIIYSLAGLFAFLNYDMIILFLKLGIKALVGSVPAAYAISHYLPDSALIEYALPALSLLLSLWILIRAGCNDNILKNIVFIGFMIMGMAAIYTIFRDAYHAFVGNNAAVILATPASFTERGLMTLIMAAIGIFMIKYRYEDHGLLIKDLGSLVLVMAASRYVYFDLLIWNPYGSPSQYVGKWPLFNSVTLTYGMGTLLLAWAMQDKDLNIKNSALKFVTLLSLFALVTLSIRQFFHGETLFRAGSISASELYAYSVIWLATGLGLLSLGIWKDHKGARMASLAFLILAIIKVFLFDAAQLEGLFRIFSFLGLGASLIGLSFFYTKFVFKSAPKQE